MQCFNEITITIINMGREFLGRTGSPFNTVAWAEAYLHAKYDLDPSSRLTTISMGQKLGALPPFWGVGSGVPI